MPVTAAASNIEPLARGAIIGDKYRIDGVLGAGGMGVVFGATHLELDAPVAIKILRAELAKNAELASQLLFEARAVARLRSAHVVRIIDVARLPSGVPYIVMEQLRGSDLASLLTAQGPLSIVDAVAYVRQACEGLREAHQLGIVHRDLKPENLFLARTPEGAVLKILDFGISKYVGGVGSALRRAPRSTLSKTGTAVGSPFYMAPEQMRAAPDLDARADIWSLGAILYELLTARCPFEAESTAALCAKVMVDDAPSLRAFSETMPAELDEILSRCLAKDPNARFQSVSELAAALDDFAALELARSSRHASGVELRFEPPKSARTTHFALAGVCVMLALAGIAFWQLQFRNATPVAPSARALSAELQASRPLAPISSVERGTTTAVARSAVKPAPAATLASPSAPAHAVLAVPESAPEPPVVAPAEVASPPSNAADDTSDPIAQPDPIAEPLSTPPSAVARPTAASIHAAVDPALRYGL